MSAHGWRVLPALFLVISFGRLAAAPPAPEQLFPAGTTEFVAISDVNKMADNWQQTQFAQLLHDPVMQPFLGDLFEKTNAQGFNYLLDTTGVDFEKVKAAAGGQLGWAVVLASPTEVAHVLTLDMNGRTPQTQSLLNEMAEKLQKKGGRFERRTLEGGMSSVVVSLPNNLQIVYGVKDTMLVVTDHLPTLQGMLLRWQGAANNTLANTAAFQAVSRKTAPRDGETAMIRFFFAPIARAEALMIYFPEMKKVKGDNFVQALKKEGVDGIKGVGGMLAFRSNGTDMLLRAATYAPQPFRGAMRMATFPNVAPLAPDSWVPADLSGYITFGLDIVNAYDSFDTLFERLCDEPAGTFKKIMNSVCVDKDGPCVDIRKDIMQQLQPRVTLINDATRPVQERSERFLVGIPARDAAAVNVLTEGVRKCFESDRRFKGRDFQGVQIWEYQSRVKSKKDGKTQKVNVPGICFAVARGNLFISTHGALLEKVLLENGPGLGKAADYQHFMQEMARLGTGACAARSFVRLDVGAEATYEMLHRNQLERADSMYAVILTHLLKDDANPKRLRADGSKLPAYGAIARYLGLTGASLTSDPDGWTIVGTILKK